MSLREACTERRYEDVAKFLLDRHMIEFDPKTIEHVLKVHGGSFESRDDCTLSCWLKSCLQSFCPEAFAGKAQHLDAEFTGCRMHVFFLDIEETPEQLQRLYEDPEGTRKSSVARSKISKTCQELTPIDTVAYRVSKDTP